jgi:MFS family permease
MSDISIIVDTESEFHRGWTVVLACFCAATFAWGFGFYGQSVYLAVLHETRGWPSAQIASATTVGYLASAIWTMHVHQAIRVLGPRQLLLAGAAILGASAIGMSRSQTLWQLYLWNIALSIGWAGMNVTAIASTLAYWFDRQRGFALNLALNGSSMGGILVTPLLVHVVRHSGLADGVTVAVFAGWTVLLPIILLGVGPSPAQVVKRTFVLQHATASPLPAPTSAAQAFRSVRFWTIALPFSLALSAQVGFIVNQMALLLPHLGADGASYAIAAMAVAAFAGRTALASFIDRLNQRRASAVTFTCQAIGLGLMLAMPDRPSALYIGSVFVGFSIGNVISLAPIVIHHEFAPHSFGLLVGLNATVGTLVMAAGPMLFGLTHDISGGYAASLSLCIVLLLVSSSIVLYVPRGDRAGFDVPRFFGEE